MIIGDDVRLRGIERSDLPFYVRWLNDPETRSHLEMIVPLSFGQEEKWYENMLSRPPIEHPLGIEIKDGEDWKLIGNTGFRNIHPHDRSAEVGIFIGEKNLWSQGYGTEAMKLMLKHGFENLNFHRIYLRVLETNPRGIRCYQKAGFLEEGRLREDRYLEGSYIDVIIMGILKDEWVNRKNGGEA